MLRFSNLKRITSLLQSSNLGNSFIPRLYFSEKTEPEEEKAKAEPAAQQETVVAEEEDEIEEIEPALIEDRGRTLSKIPLQSGARLEYYRAELEWKAKNPKFGPFDFKPDIASSGDEHLTRLQEKAFQDYDVHRVPV
jgi:hypothetical protein